MLDIWSYFLISSEINKIKESIAIIKICIDCNYNYLGPDKPIVSENQIQKFNLSVNQKIIVYQDDDEWVGIIKFDDTYPKNMKWFVELNGNSMDATELGKQWTCKSYSSTIKQIKHNKE